MYTNISLVVNENRDIKVSESSSHPTISAIALGDIDSNTELKIVFSTLTAKEVERALAFADQMEAVLDNFVSGLRLRQQDIERADERSLLGNGAGASVEADRG